MPYSIKALAAVVATAVAAPLFAADDNAIIVTATRTAQTADETLASVTVIDRQDIERSQAPDILELLRMESGIDVSRNGGAGKFTSLYLRGTDNKHTLVLIDGVRASSTTTGAFAWAQLPVSQIERIEIVRGPRASLYGSDAIGGVIQIFTRKQEHTTLRVETGSYKTYGMEIGHGGGEKVRYHFTLASKDSEDFSATNENSSYYDSDRDGYRTRSFSGGIDASLSANTTLAINAWHNQGYSEFDSGTSDSINQTVGLQLNNQTTSRWLQTLQLGSARDENDTQSGFPSQINAERNSASWQNDVEIGSKQLLTIGLDYYEEKGSNIDKSIDSTVFDESIDNNAAFVQWQWNGDASDLQVSARQDDHSAFGGHGTGQIAWGINTSDALRFTASYGTGFKAPTINNLYHPGFDFGFGIQYAGNPDLDPETSQSTELGMRYKISQLQVLQLNLYETDVEDLIALSDDYTQYINVNKVRITGMELQYAVSYNMWQHKVNLTLQNARDEIEDKPLVRRPDEKVSLRSYRNFANGGSAGAEILWTGERDDLQDITLDSYTLLNLSGHYPLTDKVQLDGRVENLLDEEYELATGFNTPGRSAYLGLRLTL